MSSCIACVSFNMSVLNPKVCSHLSHFNIASALRGASQSLQGYLGPSCLDSMWHLKDFLLCVSFGYWITFLTRRPIFMESLELSTQVFHTDCFMITVTTRILGCFVWRFFVVHENSGKRKPRLTLITGMLESPMLGLPVDDELYCAHT